MCVIVTSCNLRNGTIWKLFGPWQDKNKAARLCGQTDEPDIKI